MEYDYGHYEGLTADQIDAVQPGWNIWEDGCPGGESTDQVGSRADDFLQRYVDASVAPVVVISHGHFSRGPRRTGPETYGQHRAPVCQCYRFGIGGEGLPRRALHRSVERLD